MRGHQSLIKYTKKISRVPREPGDTIFQRFFHVKCTWIWQHKQKVVFFLLIVKQTRRQITDARAIKRLWLTVFPREFPHVQPTIGNSKPADLCEKNYPPRWRFIASRFRKWIFPTLKLRSIQKLRNQQTMMPIKPTRFYPYLTFLARLYRINIAILDDCILAHNSSIVIPKRDPLLSLAHLCYQGIPQSVVKDCLQQIMPPNVWKWLKCWENALLKCTLAEIVCSTQTDPLLCIPADFYAIVLKEHFVRVWIFMDHWKFRIDKYISSHKLFLVVGEPNSNLTGNFSNNFGRGK